jgi:hypothetical protein
MIVSFFGAGTMVPAPVDYLLLLDPPPAIATKKIMANINKTIPVEACACMVRSPLNDTKL